MSLWLFSCELVFIRGFVLFKDKINHIEVNGREERAKNSNSPVRLKESPHYLYRAGQVHKVFQVYRSEEIPRRQSPAIKSVDEISEDLNNKESHKSSILQYIQPQEGIVHIKNWRWKKEVAKKRRKIDREYFRIPSKGLSSPRW